MVKYIKILHDLLKKLPKELLIWTTIILLVLVGLFAREFYQDYRADNRQKDSLQAYIIYKLDTIATVMYNTMQRSIHNEYINDTLLNVIASVQREQLLTNMELQAVSDALPELVQSFEQIERLNEEYQRVSKTIITPITHSSVITFEAVPDKTVTIIKREEEIGIIGRIFRKLFNND